MSAVLSVVVLVGAIGWKIDEAFQHKNSNLTVVASPASAASSAAVDAATSGGYQDGLGNGTTATSNDPYDPSQISDNAVNTLAADYAIMKQNGTYTASSAAQVAQQLGANLRADVTYKPYAASDIMTDPDTSYAGMLRYRSALQASLAPLLKDTGPELDMLTQYVQTKDPSYLTKLRQAANNYKLAAAGTAQVDAPQDAVKVQLGILNAMQAFSATLSQMAASADDSFVEATLLNTYMQAQQDMFSSFNDLYTYYKSKQQ